MPEPWKCPGCNRWQAPHVDRCECEGQAAVPAPVVVPTPIYIRQDRPWWQDAPPWQYTVTSQAGAGTLYSMAGGEPPKPVMWSA